MNNITDKAKLEKMLDSGLCELTKEELTALIDSELAKDESEIDTDYIDVCFALMQTAEESVKRPVLTVKRFARVTVIAAAIVVVFISTLTVTAQIFNVNPFTKPKDKHITASTNVNSIKTTRPHKNKADKSPENSTTLSVVTVPDFLLENYTKEEIENNERLNDRFVIEFEPVYKESEYYGVICAQSIEAGTEVPVETVIVLSYIAEPQYTIMPDVYGMTGSDALYALSSAGLDGELSGTPDTEVVSCSVTAGESVLCGTRVIIYTADKVEEETTEPTTQQDSDTDTEVQQIDKNQQN